MDGAVLPRLQLDAAFHRWRHNPLPVSQSQRNIDNLPSTAARSLSPTVTSPEQQELSKALDKLQATPHYTPSSPVRYLMLVPSTATASLCEACSASSFLGPVTKRMIEQSPFSPPPFLAKLRAQVRISGMSPMLVLSAVVGE